MELNSKEFTVSCERSNCHFVKKIKNKKNQSVISQKIIIIIKSYLSSTCNPRHKIKIHSTNNLTIIKCCIVNTNYRIKPLFLVKLRRFQKIIQIIDLFFRRKIINVVMIIVKSNSFFQSLLLQQNLHFL